MGKGRGVVLYFFAIFLFLGLYMSMLQRVVGEIAVKYGLDNTAMGTIITMTFVGFMISPILTGEAADRFGRRRAVLFAFIGMLLGLGLALGINSPVGVGIGFFVSGLAFGVFEMTISSILADIVPENANKVLNYSRLCYALGTIAGPFIAMGLLSALGDWVYVMVLDVVLLIVLLLVFLRISYPVPLYPNHSTTQKGQTSVTLRILKNSTLILLGFSVMMYFAVEAGLTFYVAKYIGQLSSDMMLATLTLSVFWVFAALGRLVAARFTKELHLMIGILALVAGIGLAACLITDALVVSIAAFGVMGLGCSAIYPTLLAVGKMQFTKYTATVFGVLMSVGAVGGILQPLVMGAVADATASLKAALAACMVPLAAVIALQAVLRYRCKKEARMCAKNDNARECGQN